MLDLIVMPVPVFWLLLEGAYSAGEDLDTFELIDETAFNSCEAFDVRDGRPVDNPFET